jgi:hypothetical protein
MVFCPRVAFFQGNKQHNPGWLLKYCCNTLLKQWNLSILEGYCCNNENRSNCLNGGNEVTVGWQQWIRVTSSQWPGMLFLPLIPFLTVIQYTGPLSHGYQWSSLLTSLLVMWCEEHLPFQSCCDERFLDPRWIVWSLQLGGPPLFGCLRIPISWYVVMIWGTC